MTNSVIPGRCFRVLTPRRNPSLRSSVSRMRDRELQPTCNGRSCSQTRLRWWQSSFPEGKTASASGRLPAWKRLCLIWLEKSAGIWSSHLSSSDTAWTSGQSRRAGSSGTTSSKSFHDGCGITPHHSPLQGLRLQVHQSQLVQLSEATFRDPGAAYGNSPSSFVERATLVPRSPQIPGQISKNNATSHFADRTPTPQDAR